MNKTLKWLQERILKPSGMLLPAYHTYYGEQPAVSFKDCVEVYLKDPACKAFVDFLADQTVGMGFYTTVNPEYAESGEAKTMIDEFCEQVNLDGLLQIGAREIIATGNSLWEKVEPDRLEDLRILPLTSIEKIKRDMYGNVQGYVQSATYGGKTLPPERIIHFKWNPIDCEPFGTGLLRPLLEKLSFSGETRMSFLEMKARIEKMLPEIFEKYAGPDELWIFEGVSDERLAEYQRLIKSKPKAGARFIYNKPADVKTVQIDPRTQFQAYLEHILNQFYLGGETPLPKLFTTPGFTEASARAAVEVAERKVLALQRFIKRIVEREIFVPLIIKAGLDAKEAECRLNWGMPEKPELIVADLLRAAELELISPDEFRGIMKKFGWELANSKGLQEWYIYTDKQGRRRFVPETPDERAEYSKRLSLSGMHAKVCGLRGLEKAEFERRLRRYRSEDLKVPIRSESKDYMIEKLGKVVRGYYDDEKIEIVLLKGEEMQAIDHEIAHSIAHRIFGTTDPEKYRKYLSGEYAKAVATYISGLALEDEGEIFAWGFAFMSQKPRIARAVMRKKPPLKEFLNEIINDTKYNVGWE